MVPPLLLDPQPGERILDLCASPGSKTTQISAMMENRGLVIANEPSLARVAALRSNCERLGAMNVAITRYDGRNFPRGLFHRVLVDAPCSGLGVLRRKPDARWNKTPEQLTELPPLQKAILSSAAKAVKPGGVLVYSTCTIVPEENQAVVEDFLAAHPSFVLEKTGSLLPGKKRDDMMVQLLPQRDGTDGFFIARLRRKE